jgi:hypothetical protein
MSPQAFSNVFNSPKIDKCYEGGADFNITNRLRMKDHRFRAEGAGQQITSLQKRKRMYKEVREEKHAELDMVERQKALSLNV